MITKIVPIGNSKGIRIPNHVLKQMNINNQLELIIDETNEEIILKPVHKVRDGWTWGANYALDRLHQHVDDGLSDAFPEHKINLDLGYAWDGWDANVNGAYVSATKGVVINPGVPPSATVGWVKSHFIVSPHVGWQATDNLRVELTADNLWSYQDTLPQRMEPSYYLSVTVSY